MLSQARGLSYEVTSSALEAALVECDEIKRLGPPYNVALTPHDRPLWFAAPYLCERRTSPSPRCPIGPFPSAELLDRFAALVRGQRAALGTSARPADPSTFEAGYRGLLAWHPERCRTDVSPAVPLLQIGTRLWQHGRERTHHEPNDSPARPERNGDWTPETVEAALEWLVVEAALARRRARWLTWLVEATVMWVDPGSQQPRLLVVEHGSVQFCGEVVGDSAMPIPVQHTSALVERQRAFTPAVFDRLRVLTTEIKRLSAARVPAAVRFGPGPPLSGPRLAAALAWI
jgi:DNA polymerase III subunit epsilon